MTKRHAILQKKLHELESDLLRLLALPAADTSGHHLLLEDIKQRFVFLKNLLSAEKASHPSKPHHLRHITDRLAKLEACFHDWDDNRTTSAPVVNAKSTCSCTESCLSDEGSEEELGMTVLEDPETRSDQPVAVEEKASVDTERNVKREDGKGRGWVWSYYCGVMACGVLVGAVVMGFFMVRFSGCFHCYTEYEYEGSLIPT